MPFIFINSMGRTGPNKRKQIRKYVMLGKNRGKTRKAKSDNANEEQDEYSGLSIRMLYSMIPNKVGSEISFTHFAAPVEPPLIQDLLKCK